MDGYVIVLFGMYIIEMDGGGSLFIVMALFEPLTFGNIPIPTRSAKVHLEISPNSSQQGQRL